MFIKRKYLVRHKILNTLQKKLSQFDGQENVGDIEITLPELATMTHLEEKEIFEQMNYLHEMEDIEWSWKEGIPSYFIREKGTISHFDNKYLCDGRKEFRNDIYDIIKIVSTVILLFIAVITFVMNLVDTRRNQKDIEKIQTEMQQFNDTMNSYKHSK